MSDIFISYSKADRELAFKLSAVLEAEGWSVWWDKSLSAGETYRDEIMRQLALARAVITIWTENSIRSDWVRAEAGRAKADGKLIPTKSPTLTYADIPLPFGEMHTENVTDTHLVRAAVVAQLAKPTVQASTLRLATKTIRLQALTWVGIVGGAVTIFVNLKGLFELAGWANWLVTNWSAWLHALWTQTFAWIGLAIPPAYSPLLSFSVFVAMTVIGTKLRIRGTAADDGVATSEHTRGLIRFGKWAGAFTLLMVLKRLSTKAAMMAAFDFAFAFSIPEEDLAAYPYLTSSFAMFWNSGVSILVAILFSLLASKNRIQCLLTIALYFFFLCVFLAPSVDAFENLYGGAEQAAQDPAAVGAMVLYLEIVSYIASIGLIAIIIFTPLRAVNSRLLFLLIGAVILILLNEISGFDLPKYLAPK